MKSLHRFTLLLALLPMGCTWVSLERAAEQVELKSMEMVAHCTRVGKTTVSTLARVAGMNRYKESMQDELNTLARNSAAELGGDSVVPISPIEDGRQVFAVYRCAPPAGK